MWVFQPLGKFNQTMFLILLLLPAVLAINDPCGQGTAQQLTIPKLLKLNLPVSSSSLVPGYLPVPHNWTTRPNFRNQVFGPSPPARGFFWGFFDYQSATSFGVSCHDCVTKTNPPYSLYLWHYDRVRWSIRICKWNTVKNLGQPTYEHTGANCIVDLTFEGQAFPKGSIIGVSWVGNTVTVHDRVRMVSFYVPGAERWDVVKVWATNACPSSFQIVYEPSVFNVTTDANGLITGYSAVTMPGLYDNLFQVGADGHIPNTFSFNNWFVLTNSSTIVDGNFQSSQPLRVSCLWAIPKFTGHSNVFYFNRTMDAVCNGPSYNDTPDAFRFNLNSTEQSHYINGITLLLKSNVTLSFLCSNESHSPVTFGIPLGHTEVPYYCFLKLSNNVNSTIKFLGVLPPFVREVVVTKFGGVYINGYGYLTTGELNAINVTVRAASSDISGFWTIAATNFADVLISLNGTNIQNLLYCDDPVSSLKCSQLAFELDDGFYPLPASHSLVGEQTQSFVTLPTFNNHGFVNVTVSGSLDNSYPPKLTYKNLVVNGGDSFCVNTQQFTVQTRFNFTSQHVGSVIIDRFDTDCPFTHNTLNNYLSFGNLCFSTTQLAGACKFNFYVYSDVKFGQSYFLGALYVEHKPGDIITGMPKAAEGINDVSFVHLNVCTSYTIYGHKGEGIIRPTNTSYLAGLYYTSTSGQLLAFKNVTSGVVYSVTPCSYAQQVAFIQNKIVGVMSSVPSSNFNHTMNLPGFYYHTNNASNCTSPALVYSNLGVCSTGAIGYLPPKQEEPKVQPMFTGNVSIPTNFTMSIRTEYLQLFNNPVSIDCAMYVCNGNQRCKTLLAQYTSSCKTIESALQLSARLESLEVNSMLTVSEEALKLGTIDTFEGGGYNFTNVLGASVYKRSFIEDLLFDKVVTNGLGTVDQDYKSCSKGLSVADLACAQYFNGIMVLPGVADWDKIHMYSASLVGGMTLGGITSSAALPFSYAVQARLNYVALQTDVLQRNQQMLADSFNSAIGNITLAFESVNDAIYQTSQGLSTVAEALSKVQDVVNNQGSALNQLTVQLQNNFQAISSSINDIYSRLDQITADAQVDRLITGRLAALNAFVAQSLTKYSEVQASRQLALQKVNECVKSQSNRYGFCGGDGEHIFSLTQAAPQGLMFLHTVLVPSGFVNVTAVAGLCVSGNMAMTLRQGGFVLFVKGDEYFVSPRKMFEPRKPQVTDFVQIATCIISYVNITNEQLPDIIPDYIDVNKTLDDILASLPNNTAPDLPLEIFNQTYLNLTGEIADLEARSESLKNTTEELKQLIQNINNTLVDLQWLNRVETYIKWPWYVWLAIATAFILVVSLFDFCCISTGCCGCGGCCGSCFAGCCRGTKLQHYEPIEKVHVQ
uniref:Spike protein n=1 Tax=Bat Coronavirus SkGX17 TaxID=3018914 RepID=A0AA49EDG0_9NIDO|nr:spike protein [Bat Coronavirus SkGX17]